MSLRNRSVNTSLRRFTPYTKRPVKRLLSAARPEQNGVQSTIVEDVDSSNIPTTTLSELVNTTWKVYKASPMYKYSLRRQTIKRLAQGLQRMIRQPLLEVQLDRKLQVKFRIIDGLKLNSDDPEALILTIAERSKETSSEKKLFTCVLCTVREDTNPPLPENFVHVPVILMKGAVLLSNKVKSCLEQIFDCHIQEFNFAPYELAWMAAMWSGFVENSKKKVRLVYKTPNEAKGKTKITYEIDSIDCQKLWQSLHGKNKKELLDTEVDAFVKCLQDHFYQLCKINLSMFYLLEISMSCVAATNDGKLKIFSNEAVVICLKYLTSVFLEEQGL